MKILVVAAHPDDETLGCGGTMARLAQDGHEVFALFLADGVTSRIQGDLNLRSRQRWEREGQAKKAAEILGAEPPSSWGLPDQELDTMPLIDIVRAVEKEIGIVQPAWVLTHHPGDLNLDHRIVARAVLTATRPMPGCLAREIYAFEVPSSTEWNFGTAQPFQPTVFFDISETLDKKIEALKCYHEEIREFPHTRSEEAIRALAMWRGAQCGREAAEAFMPLRVVY